MKDAWNWCILLNLGNFVEQLRKLKNPVGQEQKTLNMVFMCATFIIFALLAYIKSKRGSKDQSFNMHLLWFMNAWLVFRQSLGAFDFEEDKPHIEQIENWHLIVTGKTITASKTVIILFCCFEKKFYRTTMGNILLFFTFVAIYAGTFGRDQLLNGLKSDPKIFLFGFTFCLIQFNIFEKVSSEFMQEIQSNIE